MSWVVSAHLYAGTFRRRSLIALRPSKNSGQYMAGTSKDPCYYLHNSRTTAGEAAARVRCRLVALGRAAPCADIPAELLVPRGAFAIDRVSPLYPPTRAPHSRYSALIPSSTENLVEVVLATSAFDRAGSHPCPLAS